MVVEGQSVGEGAPVMAIEAMKMRHVAAAPRAGRVVGLRAALGMFVHAGQPLAELAPDEA
jgi:biotin carboxyl carrier protein